jgi:hypothetical protein
MTNSGQTTLRRKDLRSQKSFRIQALFSVAMNSSTPARCRTVDVRSLRSRSYVGLARRWFAETRC